MYILIKKGKKNILLKYDFKEKRKIGDAVGFGREKGRNRIGGFPALPLQG